MSISIAPELDHRLREAAEREGQPISTWVSEAITEHLRKRHRDLGIRARVLELEEFFGPIPDDLAREVDEEMVRLGLIDRADL